MTEVQAIVPLILIGILVGSILRKIMLNSTEEDQSRFYGEREPATITEHSIGIDSLKMELKGHADGK